MIMCTNASTLIFRYVIYCDLKCIESYLEVLQFLEILEYLEDLVIQSNQVVPKQ